MLTEVLTPNKLEMFAFSLRKNDQEECNSQKLSYNKILTNYHNVPLSVLSEPPLASPPSSPLPSPCPPPPSVRQSIDSQLKYSETTFSRSSAYSSLNSLPSLLSCSSGPDLILKLVQKLYIIAKVWTNKPEVGSCSSSL